MRILITGSTGLIGCEIGKKLVEKGHEILVVSRSLAKAREMLPFPCEILVGDLNKEPLRDERLKSVDAVINLMGEPVVGGRWTEEKKQKIYNSRVVGTRNLVMSLPPSVQIFISGSAIGYYGDRGNDVLGEGDSHGTDFLAKVCVDWEAEGAKAPGRHVFIRTGVVLAHQGGALDEMLFPFRAGVGGILGKGNQWMSWIHLKDIVGLFVHAFENSHVTGALNGVAPHPVTNREFSICLANVLNRRLGPSVPIAGLKLLFGEGAHAITSSLRGSADKAQAVGYKFQYTKVDEALAEICAPFKNGEDVFYSEQYLPLPPEKVFPFFQDPHNLERITPPTLNFHIQKVSSSEITQGTLIDYTLKIHGVPVKWRTKIDQWDPPSKFVDTQLQGPYSLWHHTHEFRPFCGGTLMVDTVRYRVPMGYLGWLVAGKIVRSEVESIFSYRRKFISTMDVPRKG